MTAGGKQNDVRLCKLTDPNFAVDSHGGYCVVRIKDSFSVVVINNDNSMEVEVYASTEDDTPIDSMRFTRKSIEEYWSEDNDTIK